MSRSKVRVEIDIPEIDWNEPRMIKAEKLSVCADELRAWAILQEHVEIMRDAYRRFEQWPGSPNRPNIAEDHNYILRNPSKFGPGMKRHFGQCITAVNLDDFQSGRSNLEINRRVGLAVWMIQRLGHFRPYMKEKHAEIFTYEEKQDRSEEAA